MPWISAKDFQSFRLRDSQDHITEAAVRAGARVAPPGSVLILVRGMTLHKDVPVGLARRPLAFNQDVKAVIPKDNILSDYLAYWLLAMKSELLTFVDSASHGTGRIRTDRLTNLPIEVPSLEVQKRSVELLASLDDKIELNRKMNRTLEEIAQTLFRAWFVDFEGETDLVESEVGLIPRGWEVATVADFADLNAESWNKNTAPELIDYLDLTAVKWGVVGDPTVIPYSEAPSRARRRLRAGDSLIGTVRPANGSYALVEEASPRLTGSTGFAVLSPKHHEHRYFLYFWLSRPEFIEYLASLAHGSAYPAVRASAVHDAPIVVPPESLVSRFHGTVKPLLQRKLLTQQESRTLRELRDVLLPKLISGELRVPSANP